MDMKKILTICAALLVAASAFAQPKNGYVNTTELIQLLPAMDTVRTQLESAQKETYETYQAMIEEYQTKATTFQQKQASWGTAIRESKQKELTEIGNRIQEFEQSANQDLQQMQQTLQATRGLTRKSRRLQKSRTWLWYSISLPLPCFTSILPRASTSLLNSGQFSAFLKVAPFSLCRRNFRLKLLPSSNSNNLQKG